jgi:undecaprenyl-diphosphatase
MLEFLNGIDVQLFYFINVTLANPVTDAVMPFITDAKNWILFYLVVWFYLMLRGGRKGITAALLIIICIALSDQLSSNLLKHYFIRIRPCNALPDVHLLVGKTNSYSFPSSHAVNNFAAATLFNYFYPKLRYYLYSGAFLVAISRIFVGVHYPFDMLGGIAVGTLTALFIIYLWKIVDGRFHILNQDRQS